MMNKQFFTACILSIFTGSVHAQTKTDTVIVPLAKTSRIVFTVEDRSDLEILRHYDFQELFQDIINRLDSAGNDSSRVEVVSAREEEDWSSTIDPDDNQNNDDGDDHDGWSNTENRRGRIGRTWQSTNMDLGTNNYLSDKKFPDDANLYNVRPWGSWYIGITSIQRTRVANHLFLEWGLGVSWYNFKFENNDVLLTETDDAVEFSTDVRDLDHIKSKLTASYINASFVPVLDFGDHSRKPRMWDGHGSEFRIGAGAYVGYRIGSKSKLVYEDEDGDREREKNRESFYLNDLRYGARLQIGFKSTDFFFNYDMNELFAAGKGPKLNAISFGVIF